MRKAPFIAALVAQLSATAAWAQTTSAPAGANDRQTGATDVSQTPLAEIVVTAQKRVERLQDVPLAVNVATDAQLKDAGIVNLEALGTVVPGLNITTPTTGAFVPSIRGISTVLNASENPTALYLDGVLLPDQRDGFQDLYDVNQITVLKGPQGTLFGRNATAGVIQVTTRAPSFTTNGFASVGYGSYNTVRANAYVTGPITDKLAVSLSGSYTGQGDGWGRSLITGRDVDRLLHDETIRGKVLIKPAADTSITIIGDYNNRADVGQVFQQLPGTTYSTRGVTGVAPAGTIPPAIIPYCTTPSRYDSCSSFPESEKRQGGGVSAQLDHDFNFAKLVLISSFRRGEGNYLFDVLQVNPTYVTSFTSLLNKDFTEELQLISPSGGRFQWTFGTFYINSQTSDDPFRTDITPGSPLAPVPKAFTSIISSATEKVESVAPYAQADYKITPSTTLTLGGRFTYERRELFGSQQIVFAGLRGFTVTQPAATPNEITANVPTWRIALSHKLAPDTLIYASYNRGFKSGGFNLSSPTVAPFSPEKLDDWEAGFKSELFDRKLTFNVNGFYYDYKNIQVLYFPAGGLGAARATVGNAAAATLYGVDVDFLARPTSELTLNGGLEVLDAHFDRYDNAVLNTPATDGFGGIVQVNGSGAGDRIPLAQKFVGTLAATYKRDLGPVKLTLNTTASYEGDYYLDVNFARQKPYVLLNGSFTVASPSDRVSLRLTVSNALDKGYITRVIDSVNYAKATYGAPMIIMATAGVRF